MVETLLAAQYTAVLVCATHQVRENRLPVLPNELWLLIVDYARFGG